MNDYLVRTVDLELDELIDGLPAIALEGPKGVGKTATALRRARTVHRLDDPDERRIHVSHPQGLVQGETPVLTSGSACPTAGMWCDAPWTTDGVVAGSC